MTDAELLSLLESGGDVAVPYFDGKHLELFIDEIDPAEVLTPLKNFLSLTSDHRRKDARHLLAYCKLMIEAVGEEEILEDMGGVMPTLDTIWNHAQPTLVLFNKLNAGQDLAKKTTYVLIEGRVDWELEHGLQMSWEDGSTLVKVGAYDGHPTNSHAKADPDHDLHVFCCYIPELRTLREDL